VSPAEECGPFVSRETVEKLIRNLAVILDGVDFGGVFYFLELTALS
jgi:hypothetical protein